MNRHPLTAAVICAILMVALTAWLQPPLPVDDPRWGREHDVQFRKHARHYFGVSEDWRWFRAQGIAESGLRPHARSERGALGIMQMIPSTFEEVWKDHRLHPDIGDPRWNIAAGIAYDRYLYDRWRRRVPASQRLPFTLASYNAGYSGVSRATERARDAGEDGGDWNQVARFAPRETRNYVQRIRTLMGERG